MKKLLSVLLTAVLAVSCSVVTFSATETAEKELTSIEMTKLPEKTEYEYSTEAYYDFSSIDFDTEVESEEQLLEILSDVDFVIDVDLTGAEITATYSDGSTEVIDNDLCTTSVDDPTDIVEYYEAFANAETEEDYDAITAMIMREYTINVAYETAETTFKVNVTEPDYPGFSDVYEVVSVKNADKNTYVIEEDLYDGVISDEDTGEEYNVKYVDFDLTGMEVTLRNIETGELTTYGPDNIFLEYYFFDDEIIEPDTYYTFGFVTTEDDEEVIFDYEFELVSNSTTPEETQPSTGNTDDKDDNEPDTTTPQETTVATETKAEETTTSTANTSTTDTPTNNTNNGTVQTGNPAHAGILAVVMLSGAFVVFMIYRKKVTE